MPIGSSTFSDLGGAASSLFAGLGAEEQASLQAQGLQITAQGTLITAQGTELNAEALNIQAAGNVAEAETYTLAEKASAVMAISRLCGRAATNLASLSAATITRMVGGDPWTGE
jgi:glutamate dehydrogenase/leucine dehydrogenase